MKDLEDWISGKKDPTVKQLEKFSTTTSIPFGYLFFPALPANRYTYLIFGHHLAVL